MYEWIIGFTFFVRSGTHFPLRLKGLPILWEALSVRSEERRVGKEC